MLATISTRPRTWGRFHLQIAPQMATNFAADEDLAGGTTFRDWWSDARFLAIGFCLKREVGPQMLFDMVTQHPKLSADLSPEPERIRFIQEFFTPQDEEPDESAEGEQPIDLGGKMRHSVFGLASPLPGSSHEGCMLDMEGL